jgi:hypothetical protein
MMLDNYNDQEESDIKDLKKRVETFILQLDTEPPTLQALLSFLL